MPNRILTSHAGSDVVERQRDTGIDLVNDGESATR
jgi:hypothetical protein